MPKRPNKKTSGKRPGQKRNLIDASDDNCFWVCDGKVLKNLYDLSAALEEMSDESYGYHANLEKNDFSSWVKEVLKEPGLASSLRRAKSRADALNLVKNRLRG
jgi:hypothetical protein